MQILSQLLSYLKLPTGSSRKAILTCCYNSLLCLLYAITYNILFYVDVVERALDIRLCFGHNFAIKLVISPFLGCYVPHVK